MEDFVHNLSDDLCERVERLSEQDRRGVLVVTARRQDGEGIDYHHAAATSAGGAEGMATLEVPSGTWVVFPRAGPTSEHPESLQRMWEDAFMQWFPANPAHRAVPGPELLKVDDSEDGESAEAELWIPVERA